MALIRPCADLRNNYNEISRICHETNEPMYITRNGTNDLVVLSDEAYENLTKNFEETAEERVDRLLSEKFDKHYANFEEFQKDFWQKKLWKRRSNTWDNPPNTWKCPFPLLTNNKLHS